MRVALGPRAQLVVVWALSLATLTAVAATLETPGSMDASYHVHVAQNLAAGRGMVADVVWNYLDPASAARALPQPSHLYWMPIPAWLAWLGIRAFGAWLTPFAAAKCPFVLLASLLPVLSFWQARRLWGRLDHAAIAAVLTLAAPAYLQVWVVPESTTPFSLAACACYLACAHASRGERGHWFTAGVLAGMAHLTRADGTLLLPAAALCAWPARAAASSGEMRARTATACTAWALLGIGYLAVMAPWFARNAAILGAPLSSAPSKTLWLHTYDEIFSYQRQLSAGRWLAAGVPSLLRERGLGAVANIISFGATFQWVLPAFACVAWQALSPSERTALRPWAVHAGLLIASMCLLFTHPAQYGSLFRGASALVPWGMALVPEGVARAARAYAQFRRGPVEPARRFFRGSLVLVTVFIAGLFHAHRLYGILDQPVELWNRGPLHYVAIDAWLRERGAEGPVLVSDPPAFTLATGRASVVVPSDGPRALQAAADRYGAHWLILDATIPSLRAAWRTATPVPGFEHVREFRDSVGDPVRLLRRSGTPGPATAERQLLVGSLR